MIALIERSRQYAGNTAIIDRTGSYSYARLLQDATQLAANLLAKNRPKTRPRALPDALGL